MKTSTIFKVFAALMIALMVFTAMPAHPVAAATIYIGSAGTYNGVVVTTTCKDGAPVSYPNWFWLGNIPPAPDTCTVTFSPPVEASTMSIKWYGSDNGSETWTVSLDGVPALTFPGGTSSLSYLNLRIQSS